MDIRTNFDKIEESAASTSTPSYLIDNYPTYGHQQSNVTSGKQNIPPLCDVQVQTSSYNTWQNGVLPLNTHTSNSSVYSVNYPPKAQPRDGYDFGNKPDSAPTTNMDDFITPEDLSVGVSPIPSESFPKEGEVSFGLFNANQDKFSNFHNNFSNINEPSKPLLDGKRKKSLENTVKLIENIIFNTNKNMNNFDSATKTTSNSESKNKTSKRPKNNKTKHDNTQADSDQVSATENNPTTISVDDTNTEHSNNNEMSTKTDNPLSPETAQPVNFENVVIKQEAPEEVEYSCPIETEVMIKIEPVDSDNFLPDNINDVDNMTPFQEDSHGMPREWLKEKFEGNIIQGELSVQSAMDAVKKGSTSKQLFECPHCNILFSHPKRFLIHNKWHSFWLTSERRMMIARAREQKKNQNKEARALDRMNSKEVKLDETTATDDKVFPCKDCDKVFVNKTTLRNHRLRYHPVQNRACRICGEHVSGWSALRAHMASHGSDAGFHCTQCNKKFSSLQSLAKHSGTHMEKTVSCPECPKMFGSMAQLRAHARCHERERSGTKFSCSLCGKGFYEIYTLQVHERVHRNERPFECNICKTTFGTNSGLKRHIKVSHNANKPFECPTCHRSFVSSNIRDRHVLRHHGDPSEFPFHCHLCDCRYMKRKDLNHHIYKTHPKGKSKDGDSASSDEEFIC